MTDSFNEPSTDRFDRRAELYEQFAVVPVAFSTNGRTVDFAGPLDIGITIGGFALVEHEQGLAPCTCTMSGSQSGQARWRLTAPRLTSASASRCVTSAVKASCSGC